MIRRDAPKKKKTALSTPPVLLLLPFPLARHDSGCVSVELRSGWNQMFRERGKLILRVATNSPALIGTQQIYKGSKSGPRRQESAE